MSHIEHKQPQIRFLAPLARQLRLAEITACIRFWLGYRAYWQGYYRSAFNLLEPLAKSGHAAAQYYLGRMCARAEGMERDLGNAIRWWNASAGAGEPWSQVAMGSLYERGKVVPRDRGKALKWYLRAAHHGLPEAQLRVGYFYEFGLGTDRDVARARRWYVEASCASKTPEPQLRPDNRLHSRSARRRHRKAYASPSPRRGRAHRQRWSKRPHQRRRLPSR